MSTPLRLIDYHVAPTDRMSPDTAPCVYQRRVHGPASPAAVDRARGAQSSRGTARNVCKMIGQSPIRTIRFGLFVVCIFCVRIPAVDICPTCASQSQNLIFSGRVSWAASKILQEAERSLNRGLESTQYIQYTHAVQLILVLHTKHTTYTTSRQF